MEASGRIVIGALSKHTGTNIETIRYYERVGLLPAPARSSGGYRLYDRRSPQAASFHRDHVAVRRLDEARGRPEVRRPLRPGLPDVADRPLRHRPARCRRARRPA
jgi:MerR family transcriptional regulator, mercuric resistance operon regulatory protein